MFRPIQHSRRNSFKLLLGLSFYFSSLTVSGQSRTYGNNKYVLWFTPSGANHIYGLAVGFMAEPEFAGVQQIDGINCEVGPWGAFTFFVIPFSTFFAPFLGPDENPLYSGNAYMEPEQHAEIINGINISLGGHAGPSRVSGISINGVWTRVASSRGFVFSGFMNLTYEYHGVMATLLRNKATVGHGWMIGLSNNCQDCTGIQIGLINRMGNRVLPLVNFRPKSKRRR